MTALATQPQTPIDMNPNQIGNSIIRSLRTFPAPVPATVLALALMATHPALGFRAEEGPVSLMRSNVQPAAVNSQTDVVSKKPVSQTQQAAAVAAETEGMKIQWDEKTGTPSSIRGTDLLKSGSFAVMRANVVQSSPQSKALAVLSNLSQVYGIKDAAGEFSTTQSADVDSLGFKHVKVSQVYQGFRVVGGDLSVHFNKDGTPYEVSGSYVKDVAPSLQRKFAANDAVQYAQRGLAARGFARSTLQGTPELVVYALGVPQPILSYEMVMRVDDSHLYRCWVNARTGELVNFLSMIMPIGAPTTGGSAVGITGNLLAGEGGSSVSIPGWRQNASTYYLNNFTNLWYIFNVNPNSRYSDYSTYAFRSTGAWGQTDPTEVSAALNMNTVQSYYRTVHGRNSINNAGMMGRCEVHYGVNYVNAYWDGSKMVFGDGDGRIANSLAVLDVTGHEVTHGVTQNTANLIYQDEPGALNESFSDIFGAIIEFYGQNDGRSSYPNVNPGRADWLMGEDCWISSKALRDMKNPSSTTTLEMGSQQPSRYKGTYWYDGMGDNGGVHYNSGVQNFFFYLLCEGGSGNNDGISYSVTGIGINNARLVAYRALTVYCRSTTDYPAVRNAWISAAQDLNPSWVSSVTAAWAAVGVGPSAPTAQTPSFTPPAGIYQSAINVTISSTTPGAIIRYTVDGSDPTELSSVYTGAVNVSTETTLKAKAFKAGLQPSPTAVGLYQFTGTPLYRYTMDSSPNWSVTGQWAFGRPTGQGGGSGSPDPTSGYTGANVYGYNLNGTYENNLPSTQWLTTTAINLSNASDVVLGFWRRLGVEHSNYDHAYIEVSNNGSSWNRVWQNTSEIADANWTYVSYDISAYADRQSRVFIRWGIGPTDSSVTYCGWNIDDVMIFGRTTGSTVPIAPSDLSADASSSTTVHLSWQDKSSDEQGFAIERKNGVNGSWAEIDRVGAGVQEYNDSQLAANTTYVYRCRAFNATGNSGYSNEAQATTTQTGGDQWDPVDDAPSGATALADPTNVEQSHGRHTLSNSDRADWYKVNLLAGVPYNFNTAGGTGDDYAELYSDNAGTVLVAQDDDSAGGTQFSLRYTPPASGYYYLKIRVFNPGQSAVYDLKYSGNVTNVPQSNDMFAGATTISSAGTFTCSNNDATKEAGEPNHAGNPGGRSVWWRWTAAASGPCTIDTIGSTFDTTLAVYTGNSVNALTVVASNDDAVGYVSRVTFNAVRGTTYRIAVDGYSGERGNVILNMAQAADTSTRVISLSGDLAFGSVNTGSSATRTLTIANTGNSPLTVSGISCPSGFNVNWTGGTIAAGSSQAVTVTFTPNASSTFAGNIVITGNQTSGGNAIAVSGTGVNAGVVNDMFSSASVITSAGAYYGTNVIATKEAGEPNHAGNPGGKSLWWTWTAPSSGQCTIDTVGSSFDTTLAVYTGDSVGALSLIGANDDDQGLTSRVTFNASQGTTYRIAVDGYNGNSGRITLNVAQMANSTTRIISMSGSLAFGNVNVGSSSTRTIAISNGGNAPLTVSGIACPAGFSVNWNGGVISPGASQLVAVTFAPQSAGPAGGTLAVNGDQTSGVNTMAVSGTGVTGASSNDMFANSAVINDAGTFNGSNLNATKEQGEPNHAGVTGGKSVWWRWTATSSGPCTVDTIGSSFDTVLGVYTGNSVGALSLIAANDDMGGGSYSSRVSFNAVAGTTYRIAVDGYAGSSGSLVLNVTKNADTSTRVLSLNGNLSFGNVNIGTTVTRAFTISNLGNGALTISGIVLPAGFVINWNGGVIAPGGSQSVTLSFTPSSANFYGGTLTVNGNQTSGANTLQVSGTGVASGVSNDMFSSGTLITSPGSYSGSNRNATKEPGEPNHAGNPGGKSLWWIWTAPTSGPCTIDTIGSNFDTTLGVYIGNSVNNLTFIGGNDDYQGQGYTSRVSFNAVAGTTYRIAVDGFRGPIDNGNIILNLSRR